MKDNTMNKNTSYTGTNSSQSRTNTQQQTRQSSPSSEKGRDMRSADSGIGRKDRSSTVESRHESRGIVDKDLQRGTQSGQRSTQSGTLKQSSSTQTDRTNSSSRLWSNDSSGRNDKSGVGFNERKS